MKTLNCIANEINQAKSLLIFCHTRPDGDTLGSAFALYNALIKKGVRCDIVCDGIIPDKYSFYPLCKSVLLPEKVNEKYDIHLAVDVATENLLGRSWGIFTSTEKTYSIDHHLSNERFAKVNYVSDCPATTILVLKLIEEMGVSIDKDIANAILMGIITDTALFANDNVNEECLTISAKMIELGADMKAIVKNIFKSQSKARAQMYAEVIGRMRFYLQDKLAIVTITLQDLQKYGLSDDVSEGFVDFPRSIDGVEVAVSILQVKDELFRISFRSRGKVNVNDVASEFGGGGHPSASGCVVKGMYEEVIEKIVRAVDINIY